MVYDMHKKKISYILGLLCVLMVYALHFQLRMFYELESRSYDYRLEFKSGKKPSDKIIIAAIDEESLSQLGRWPWDRSVHAKFIDVVKKAGAKVVLLDVLFAEKSSANSDRALIDAAKKAGNVVCEVFFDFSGKTITKKHPLIEGLEESASCVGSPNVFPETDGVLRKVRPVFFYEGKIYTHITISVASAYLNKPWQDLTRNLPLDDNAEMLVNYYGPFGTIRYLSYYDILAGKIDNSELKDKIILVGYAAAGLGDRHVTPFGIMPGIETIASNINALLNSDFIKYSSQTANIIIFLFVGCMLTIVLPKLSAWKSTLLTASVFVIWTAITYYYFTYRNTWIEYTPIALLILSLYVLITSWRFMTEEKEKRWLKKTFGQYLSPSVINEIMKNPDALALGGKRQEMTVLFSDIRGFTTISEASSPEEIVALLNEYLTKMTEIVFKYQGTLDKFIGDAVMAFWNAPIPQKDHPGRAVMCAVEMIEELKILQEKWRAEKKPIIDIGIGVNTGDMVVGNMGSIERMDYTVIGDNVNLGARLESLNKEYKTHIIISESTYNHVKDIVKTKPLGSAKVKGKEKLVQIYNVEGRL